MDDDRLLERIDAYCQRYRISERTFGLRAVNNSYLVGNLREGGSLTVRTLKKLEAFMASPTKEGRQKVSEQAAAAA